MQDNNDAGQDRDQDQRTRYTVPEAANLLGVSQDAVRKRIARHTIESERDEAGRVYVYLDEAETAKAADQDDVPTLDSAALTSQMQARIDDLREQLEAEREANRENRRIIAGLTQRIPAIEGSAGETTEGHEGAQYRPETTARSQHTPDASEAPESPESENTRPWWRFW